MSYGYRWRKIIYYIIMSLCQFSKCVPVISIILSENRDRAFINSPSLYILRMLMKSTILEFRTDHGVNTIETR